MKHTVNLCNSTRAVHPGFNISASEGTIKIHQEQSYVCCAYIGLGWGLEGKVIKIYEDNIGDMCKCTCPLELDIEIWDAEGYERVEIYGIRFKQVQDYELLFNSTIPG